MNQEGAGETHDIILPTAVNGAETNKRIPWVVPLC